MADYNATARTLATTAAKKKYSTLGLVRLQHGTLVSEDLQQFRVQFPGQTDKTPKLATRVTWTDDAGTDVYLSNRAGNVIVLKDGASAGIGNVAAVLSPHGLSHAHHYYDVVTKEAGEGKLQLFDKTVWVYDCVPPIIVP